MPKFAAMERVATNIKEALRERGWDQKDLADALGKDPSNISKTLRGKYSPSVETLEQIAIVLEIDIADLFRETKLVA